MQRISKRKLASYPRPLQGGMRVLGSGGGQTLAGAYQAALDKANAANEARYQQLIGGYDELRGSIAGGLKDVGNQEFRDIDRTYKSMGSDVYQRLVNRGFANSTLPATQQMGVERERSAARSRLASDLAQQKAGYESSIAQAKLGMMERRNDVGPDPGQMIALSQGLGQAGYGQGAGGGVGYGQPIGITPNQYQNMYAQGLARHFAFTPRGGPMAPTQARMRALMRRQDMAANGGAMPRPSKNVISQHRSTNLPQNIVGPMGYQPTNPGPWRSGYGAGPSGFGPYQSGYRQPLDGVDYSSYMRPVHRGGLPSIVEYR